MRLHFVLFYRIVILQQQKKLHKMIFFFPIGVMVVGRVLKKVLL